MIILVTQQAKPQLNNSIACVLNRLSTSQKASLGTSRFCSLPIHYCGATFVYIHFVHITCTSACSTAHKWNIVCRASIRNKPVLYQKFHKTQENVYSIHYKPTHKHNYFIFYGVHCIDDDSWLHTSTGSPTSSVDAVAQWKRKKKKKKVLH